MSSVLTYSMLRLLLVPPRIVFDRRSCHRVSGEAVVARSIEMGQPVAFVALNYRLHAFGFLGSKEVKDAGVGNLGLHDREYNSRSFPR